MISPITTINGCNVFRVCMTVLQVVTQRHNFILGSNIVLVISSHLGTHLLKPELHEAGFLSQDSKLGISSVYPGLLACYCRKNRLQSY